MIDQISIIMPAYNASKFIEASINSVISQTYKYWELIIVDDGSTDETFATIQKYSLIDNRIKILRQENKRQGEAKNYAIKNSLGTYLAFLDADDLWLPDKLLISLRELQKGNFDLLFTNSYFFEGEFVETSRHKTLGITERIYHGKEGILMFLENNRIPNLTVVVKKEVLVAAGPFENMYAAEDYEMWLRLLSLGATFKALKEPLSIYRMHEQSISAKDRNAIYESVLVLNNFAFKNDDFKEIVSQISKVKFRFWLYNDPMLTKPKIRVLLPFITSSVFKSPIVLASYMFPLSILRKLINRIIL